MTIVASKYARKENDLYQTAPWATEALLKPLPQLIPTPIEEMLIWEPAAGNHMIADILRAHRANVITSDIMIYDRQHDEIIDFLATRFRPENPFLRIPDPPHMAIITNPPYGRGNRNAVKFARLALDRCQGLVALLLTAKFDFGKTRTFLFRDNPRFMGKIVLMDRIQWFPGDTSGTEDHAWYLWGPEAHAPFVHQIFYEENPAKVKARHASSKDHRKARGARSKAPAIG